MQNKKNGLKIMIGALLFVVAVVGMLFVYQNTRPETTAGSKEIKIQVVIPEEDTKEFILHTDAEYLRQALDEENLIQGSDSQYGFFITEVNNRKADDTNQEWWMITKKGEDVLVGVDQIAIQDGDQYELTLKIGY